MYNKEALNGHCVQKESLRGTWCPPEDRPFALSVETYAMKISKIRIRNFRSVQSLDLTLDDTTVFIGANNAGKSAVLDALRIALTRRWGQRGTGFTEHDIYAPAPDCDPRTLPPVSIDVMLEEPAPKVWPDELVQALDHIMTVRPDGRNIIVLRVQCAWNHELETFEPSWSFLDWQDNPLTGNAKRATNLSGLFNYVPLFWLDALRDANDEFSPRSQLWGHLVRSIRIPKSTEADVQKVLDELDSKLLEADPKLSEIADTIGQATTIAIGEGPGAARLRMLPLNVWDMLNRAGVVMRHEDMRPWLPLDHHGQGLQSLSVIFLFQAAVLEQLAGGDRVGAEPVFAIEEPEAHLHPQASRALWERVSALPGQKLITTHSPYFVQHVPLRDLRIVRLVGGKTQIAQMPRMISSRLPWNEKVAKLAEYSDGRLVPDPSSGNVAAVAWLPQHTASALANCWKADPEEPSRRVEVARLREASRVMIMPNEENELGFAGRRVRGEVFFARRWALVEGICEYLLLHAIGRAFDYPLDTHGISVIDFQNNGNASIYPSVADAFKIPWRMVTDGDSESAKFRKQLLERGFSEQELNERVTTLAQPNTLEDQLIVDGHVVLLRDALAAAGHVDATTMSLEELRKRLKNRKTEYMPHLAARVAGDRTLAEKMPAPYPALVNWLQSNSP
jgi:putative ATP-dependent endonuclease of OLD family